MDHTLSAELRRLFAAEPDTTVTARRRAAALRPPDPEVGSLLRWALRTTGARAVIEVGAAGGVTGSWMIPELPERGVLTSIEPDAHAHGLATDAFHAMAAGARVRAILGDPNTVLGRLSDGAYDLMLLQGSPPLSAGLLSHVHRLLRPGGLLLSRGVLRGGEDADDVAVALRDLSEDLGITTTVLPLDDGLLLASVAREAAAASDGG